MMGQGTFRLQGDFANKRAVDYATVLVDLPHGLLLTNLQKPRYEHDLVTGLQVSSAGRLTLSPLRYSALTQEELCQTVEPAAR